MYQYACFIHHRDVEWAPVLEEREVKQMFVDRKVVVCRVVVGARRRATTGTRTHAWGIAGHERLRVERLRTRCRVRECGEV